MQAMPQNQQKPLQVGIPSIYNKRLFLVEDIQRSRHGHIWITQYMYKCSLVKYQSNQSIVNKVIPNLVIVLKYTLDGQGH